MYLISPAAGITEELAKKYLESGVWRCKDKTAINQIPCDLNQFDYFIEDSFGVSEEDFKKALIENAPYLFVKDPSGISVTLKK